MNLFVRLAVTCSVACTASLAAQSPRVALDLGAGGSSTYGGDYRGTGGTALNATAAVRFAQISGVGLQMIAATTHTFLTGDVTLLCVPTPRGGCAPTGFTGTQYTAGLAIEKLIAPLLSVRSGAGAGWFAGDETRGAGAHAYPVFLQLTVPLRDHFGIFAAASRTYLRDLGGDDLHMNVLGAGVRFN